MMDSAQQSEETYYGRSEIGRRNNLITCAPWKLHQLVKRDSYPDTTALHSVTTWFISHHGPIRRSSHERATIQLFLERLCTNYQRHGWL